MQVVDYASLSVYLFINVVYVCMAMVINTIYTLRTNLYCTHLVLPGLQGRLIVSACVIIAKCL